METKSTTERTTGASARAKSKIADAEPFAAMADAAPLKKRVIEKEPAAAKETAKSAKKRPANSSKTIVSDPFAATVEGVSPVKKASKGPTKTVNKSAKTPTLDVTGELASTEPKVDLSPAFLALAEPVLPELKRENRARLQMQTPRRLYFYWSAKENPWALLRDAFGGEMGSYALVLKLTNLQRDTEEIVAAEAEGNYWFDVEPGSSYQAEIGFYAPNRPYFRVIYSNTVETPRRSPSPRVATDADWRVSANKFAEVLNVAGFSRDAFDVAMAGDDVAASEDVTHTAFSRLIGTANYEVPGITAEDIRYAMLALASGVTLEDLGRRISPALLAILQANTDKLESGKAMSALTEYFDIEESEFSEEQFGPAVYGASLVNFPRTLKTRGLSPKEGLRYNPVSSHSYR